MRNDKISQEKYYQREYFSIDEKYDIWRKSGGKCCHCGKEIYPGVEHSMTVDHFIPLFKGGSNRFINLIPLCEDCNKNKDDKIYSMEYIKYLKDKHYTELKNYLDAYLQVTDYVQRNRLLAYDEYEEYAILHKTRNGIKTKFKLKLATWDDFDKIKDYFIKYLKKYDELSSIEVAEQNISFWLRFGCIYYVEKDNEIKVMAAITIKALGKNEDFRGINNQPFIYIFSYYNTELSNSIVANIIYTLPNHILQENNLKFMPINLVFISKDKIKDFITAVYKAEVQPDQVDTFSVVHMLVGDISEQNEEITIDNMTTDEKTVYEFFKKFDNVYEGLIEFFTTYTDRDISWMISCLFSAQLIAQDQRLMNLVTMEVIE